MSNSTAVAANLQLKAVGPIDDYITKDATYSLFTNEYDKITQFARNTVTENFNEHVDFSRTATCTLPYQGDFLSSIHLYVELPIIDVPSDSTYATWTNSIGFALIEQLDLYIGDKLVDRQNGLLMEIYDYLTTPESHRITHNQKVGRYDNVLTLQQQTSTTTMKLLIPLNFWFCKKPVRNALPLVSMTKSNIKISVKFRKFEDVITYDGPTMPAEKHITSCSLICDYYMIDKEEKSDYINAYQNTLIHQWISNRSEITANMPFAKIILNVVKPVKELILVAQEYESVVNNDYFNFGNRSAGFYESSIGFIDSIGLTIDGNTRFEMLPESLYRTYSEQYHTHSGNRNIHIIPFSEQPEEIAPSGSINMSRFQHVEISCRLKTPHPHIIVNVFALTYNVLTFENGYPMIEFVN